MRTRTLSELDAERPFEIIAKRRGNRVRWFNFRTGEWLPGWYPLFVNVPKDFNVIGMTVNEFNTAAREQGWRGR